MKYNLKRVPREPPVGTILITQESCATRFAGWEHPPTDVATPLASSAAVSREKCFNGRISRKDSFVKLLFCFLDWDRPLIPIQCLAEGPPTCPKRGGSSGRYCTRGFGRQEVCRWGRRRRQIGAATNWHQVVRTVGNTGNKRVFPQMTGFEMLVKNLNER